MPNYVRKGAKLKCSMGSNSVQLQCEEPMANIMDCKPMINIKPFGQCKSLKSVCVPSTMAGWLQGKNDVFVRGQPALMDNCRCLCAAAGEIQITDAADNIYAR